LDHTPEELERWIKDPEEIKPGNLMTGKYGDLKQEEVDALVEYLMSLKVDEE
jgi:cytochrome c oxidase subunit II